LGAPKAGALPETHHTLEGDAPSSPFAENPSVSWGLRERKSLRTACQNPKAQKQPAIGKICEYVGLTLMAGEGFLHFRFSACQHFHSAPSVSWGLCERSPQRSAALA
jgi:hypothetical protein